MNNDVFYNMVISIVSLITLLVNQNSNHKKNKVDLKKLEINLKRVELNQAIEHDYGYKIVVQLLDEYQAIGGNSYMTHKANQYLTRKEDERRGNLTQWD